MFFRIFFVFCSFLTLNSWAIGPAEDPCHRKIGDVATWLASERELRGTLVGVPHPMLMPDGLNFAIRRGSRFVVKRLSDGERVGAAILPALGSENVLFTFVAGRIFVDDDAMESRRVHVRDVINGKLLATFPSGFHHQIALTVQRALATVSPDGRYLATVDGDRKGLVVYDVDAQGTACARTEDGSLASSGILVFSADRRTVVSVHTGLFAGASTGEVFAFDGKSLTLLRALNDPSMMPAPVSPDAPANPRAALAASMMDMRSTKEMLVSDDGKAMALTVRSGRRGAEITEVEFWDLEKGELERKVTVGSRVSLHRASADFRTFFLSALVDDQYLFFALRRNQGGRIPLLRVPPLRQAQFSPDATLAYGVTENDEIREWRVPALPAAP